MLTFIAELRYADGQEYRMGIQILEGQMRVLGYHPSDLKDLFNENDLFRPSPLGVIKPQKGTVEELLIKVASLRGTKVSLEPTEILYFPDPGDKLPRLGILTKMDSFTPLGESAPS